MKVRNPRNGELDYELKVDSIEEISDKANQARKHQALWLKKGVEYRSELIGEFGERLAGVSEELFEQLSIDTGRRRIARIEIEGVLGLIKGRCMTAPTLMAPVEERNSLTSPTVKIKQQLIPYQLVGAISPWNFPLLLAMIDAIPALLSGSAVLLKPSEVTPRFMDVVEKVILCMPDLSRVFKLVRGGADAGKAVVNSSDVICFTGSVETGRKIGMRCAERFIPAFLELGGKDPAIVLADADLNMTADAIIRSAIGASGQACQSLERVYVDELIFDKFLETLLNKVLPLKFNSDYSKGGIIGPLIFKGQAEKIQAQLNDAVEKGAEILIGGMIKEIDGGIWMEPTILRNVDHSMDIMREETFGPVIPMMHFSTVDQAVELSNDSQFGLSASVFSANEENALTVASRIQAGGISINDASLTNKVFDAEKNAFKFSGLYGSRMGAAGFMRFFRKKALLIQTEKASSISEQAELIDE